MTTSALSSARPFRATTMVPMASHLTPIPSAPATCPDTVEDLVAELVASLMAHLEARGLRRAA